jgi:thiamine biosynthesis protein ThiS
LDAQQNSQREVTVNGEHRSFVAGTTLLDVIRALELEPARVAVELNREIVRRDLWASVVIETGAGIEIVQFVGGG